MRPWLLLTLTALFAYLAYDARSSASSHNHLPYSAISKLWGQDTAHLSLTDQERLKTLSNRYGVGTMSQTTWLFSVLAIGCGIGAVLAFLE